MLYNVLFFCYYGVQSNVLVNPKIANLLRLLLVVLPTALPIYNMRIYPTDRSPASMFIGLLYQWIQNTVIYTYGRRTLPVHPLTLSFYYSNPYFHQVLYLWIFYPYGRIYCIYVIYFQPDSPVKQNFRCRLHLLFKFIVDSCSWSACRILNLLKLLSQLSNHYGFFNLSKAIQH